METETRPQATISPEAEERELCPGCLTGDVPGRHFCKECGGPLSAHAAFGPFERIFAEGYIYRTAAERPHKFIVVLGIWLIFGPQALMGVALPFQITDMIGGFDGGDVLELLFMLFILTISVTLIVKTTRNYIAWRSLTGGAAS